MIMRLSEITKKELQPSIQKGEASWKDSLAIKDNILKLVKSNIKQSKDDWTIHSEVKYPISFGLQYTGNDTHYAQTVLDKLIGDVYGYFVDGPVKQRTRTKNVVNNNEQIKFVVTPTHTPGKPDTKKDDQISFWHNRQDGVFGLEIFPYKK